MLSKGDLLEEEFDEADMLLAAQGLAEQQCTEAGGPQGTMSISGAADQSMHAAKAESIATEQPQHQVGSAVQFAAALPHALRVSSTSGHGVERLKLGMLATLEQHDLQQQLKEQQPDPEVEDA